MTCFKKSFYLKNIIVGISMSSLFLYSLVAQAEVIKAGQKLTFVLSENKANADEVRQQYFSKAFPLAQAAGMKEITTFKPTMIMGGGNPDGSGLYLWPSNEAANSTRNDPVYIKDYRPLRTQAWNQLQAIDIDVKEQMEITFDKTKVYSVVFIWLKDKAKYEQYFKATQVVRDRLGVKTLIKLPTSRYDKLTEGEITSPDLLIMLQWNKKEDFQAYSHSPEFKAVEETFMQSLNGFEWYQLDFWN
jgi:uncharacterized protein (DUF1330 family)